MNTKTASSYMASKKSRDKVTWSMYNINNFHQMEQNKQIIKEAVKEAWKINSECKNTFVMTRYEI